MELSRYLREKAKAIPGKEQFFWNAFARSFEVCLLSIQVYFMLFGTSDHSSTIVLQCWA